MREGRGARCSCADATRRWLYNQHRPAPAGRGLHPRLHRRRLLLGTGAQPCRDGGRHRQLALLWRLHFQIQEARRLALPASSPTMPSSPICATCSWTQRTRATAWASGWCRALSTHPNWRSCAAICSPRVMPTNCTVAMVALNCSPLQRTGWRALTLEPLNFEPLNH